ncbi:MAG: tRNA (adenosine(37)-N6)-threonylcarbamoyltransferase complex ATPase subunit type 1 TsaE [Helicobacteraceae bacterium]|jgi:tRNA threonylcarbamoyladenosine biosynthesis protein TsaE|nr:tRNA (adenosine(37)-N6)-threonylcarbamoyltransferase complex ATPase subunit type 1 TsaE [Helicobacteraceae bacterium]
MTRTIAENPEDFDPICRWLLASRKEGIALLSGVLGAGKTTFVKRFALQLGLTEAASPSFGIMHEYAPNLRHFDLYRVGGEAFFARGLQDTLESGWNFIEWADKAVEDYLQKGGASYIKIHIDLDGDKRVANLYDE